jgi:hypothetical protein
MAIRPSPICEPRQLPGLRQQRQLSRHRRGGQPDALLSGQAAAAGLKRPAARAGACPSDCRTAGKSLALIDNGACFWPFLARVRFNRASQRCRDKRESVLIETSAEAMRPQAFPADQCSPASARETKIFLATSRPTCWIIYAGFVKNTDGFKKRD